MKVLTGIERRMCEFIGKMSHDAWAQRLNACIVTRWSDKVYLFLCTRLYWLR